LHTAATASFSKELINGVNDLAIYESGFTAGVITASSTAIAAVPAAESVLLAVNRARLDAPMNNLTIHQALSKFGTNKAVQASNLISDAILRNLTKDEAKSALVSLLNVTKVQAEALVRSSVNLTANTARQATYLENADVIKHTKYVAKLDGRTTEICQEYNGQLFEVGKNPAGTLHFGCRSQIVAVVSREYIK